MRDPGNEVGMVFFFLQGGKPENHGDKMLFHLSHSVILGLSKKKEKTELTYCSQRIRRSNFLVW